MARPFAIMTGNLYLCEHGDGFSWTMDDRQAKRFANERAVQSFIDQYVSGRLRVVRVA